MRQSDGELWNSDLKVLGFGRMEQMEVQEKENQVSCLGAGEEISRFQQDLHANSKVGEK